MRTKSHLNKIISTLFLAVGFFLSLSSLGIAEVRTYNAAKAIEPQIADRRTITINSNNIINFNNAQFSCQNLLIDLANLNGPLTLSIYDNPNSDTGIDVRVTIPGVSVRFYVISDFLRYISIIATNFNDRICTYANSNRVRLLFVDLNDGDDLLISTLRLRSLGGDGNDMILGSACSDIISGGNGDDRIYGGKGNDYLYGDMGKDAVYGEEGDDVIDGGGGDDSNEGDLEDLATGYRRYGLYGGPGNDLIIDPEGDDYMWGGEGNDCIQGGPGSDAIFGGFGDDRLYGYEACPGQEEYGAAPDGNDLICGGAGNNIIYGGPGNDHLYGADGDDEIYGEEGDDYIDGREGNNYLDGGPGDNDIYEGGGLGINDRPLPVIPPLEPFETN